MLGVELRISTVAGVLTDLPETSHRSASWNCNSSIRNISYHLSSRNRHCRKSRFMVICSKSSRGSFNRKSNQSDEPGDDYIEAVVLVSGIGNYCFALSSDNFLLKNTDADNIFFMNITLLKCMRKIRFFSLQFYFFNQCSSTAISKFKNGKLVALLLAPRTLNKLLSQ